MMQVRKQGPLMPLASSRGLRYHPHIQPDIFPDIFRVSQRLRLVNIWKINDIYGGDPKNQPDIQPDIFPDMQMSRRKQKAKIPVLAHKDEDTSMMEPTLVSQEAPRRAELVDLAVELAARAAGFKRSVPEGMLGPLADLVRSMNCYYSNIIEGHYTHPIDIERALNNDYHADAKKRDLQKEAKAHITVQQ